VTHLIDIKTILQVNATMIAGLLILLTVSTISSTATDSNAIIFANRLNRLATAGQ
jgi:hypothetical protein